jgi:hypothetical protein
VHISSYSSRPVTCGEIRHNWEDLTWSRVSAACDCDAWTKFRYFKRRICYKSSLCAIVLPIYSWFAIEQYLWSSGQSSRLEIQRSGFVSRRYQIFWEVVGSGTGSTQPREYNCGDTLKKSSGSGLEIREYGRRDPSRWPRSTFYPQKLALTSPTSGIVRSRTQVTEFVCLFVLYHRRKHFRSGTDTNLRSSLKLTPPLPIFVVVHALVFVWILSLPSPCLPSLLQSCVAFVLHGCMIPLHFLTKETHPEAEKLILSILATKLHWEFWIN